MIADLAAVFHWSPSELYEIDCDELLAWHAQARRVVEAMQ